MASKCQMCGYTDNDDQTLADSVQETHPDYLSPFMTSNDAPSEFAKTQIVQELAAETEALTELESCIADLRTQLGELLKQRQRRQCKINDFKFALNPVRHVPADVLSEIFFFFLTPLDVYSRKESSVDPKTTMLWILPQVCKLWRAVSLSAPRLWSTIRLVRSDFQHPESGVRSNALFRLGTQIYRSSNIPLSVSIITVDEQFSSDHPLLQVLFPTAERWKELVLWIPFVSFNSLRHCPASFLNLTSLHLWPHAHHSHWQDNTLPVWNMFRFCPQLSSLTIAPDWLPRWRLPLNQIKQYICTCSPAPNTVDCITALAVFPNLILCDTKYADGQDVDNLQDIRHDKLEELKLCKDADDPPHRACLLKFLHAPSLRNLELTHLSGIDHLLPFLQRSGHQLTCLRLESPLLNDADCIKVLDQVPSLNSLTLNCPSVHTTTFVKRLISRDEPRFIPSLTFLEILGDDAFAFEAEDIVQLKETRPGLSLLGGGFSIRGGIV